ncbi:TetR family transcriptional regulator [Bacteroidota bacterium]
MLEAALYLFAQEGYAVATSNKIAKTSGVYERLIMHSNL